MSNNGRPRIAYTMSRFPKITETFILYEILALRRQGWEVLVYPLLRERQPVAHPEAEKMVQQARFLPFLSWAVLRAHLHYLARRPLAYFKALQEVLSGTWGNLNFFVGALGIFPKSVRMAYEMERQGVSHLHAHFATHPAVAALIVQRLTGIPFSFTAHGSDLHVERRMLGDKVKASRFAVTVSRYNKELMVRECGREFRAKIHIIHCGVDPNEFRPPVVRQSGSALRILCVASFEEVKGHRILIEALRLVARRGVDFECHLVGDGPLRTSVARQVERSGLKSWVTFHGPLARPAVVQALQKADLKVLASLPTRQGKREGIPVVLMEAMSCGLPVVASALSGIPELVEDGVTGRLVPPQDARRLAGAIQDLAQDEGLRLRMGQAGRQKVVTEFSLEGNCSRLAELFQATNAAARPEIFTQRRRGAERQRRMLSGRPA